MRKTLAAVAIIAILSLAGCGSDEKGTGDSPVGGFDDSPAFAINFPNLFMNVAHKCYGVNGIYTHTRPGPPVIVVNDPMCVKGEGDK